MTRITTQPFSLSTLASASALAWAISSSLSAAPSLPAEEAKTIKFEYSNTNPSNESLQIIFNPAPQTSFEDRISSFYSQLSASQEDLGSEYEELLMSNLSSLYED
jgi:hypothetical protein